MLFDANRRKGVPLRLERLLLDVRDRVRELRPLTEARLEPRESLDNEAELVRVGRVAQTVEHVTDGDIERDKLDQVVPNQVAKERRGER